MSTSPSTWPPTDQPDATRDAYCAICGRWTEPESPGSKVLAIPHTLACPERWYKR